MSEALIVVDFQNDFAAPDGALSVRGGDEIAPRVNALAADPRFARVIATRDWHPPDHRSFVTQGGPWPVHCVQGTPGAELHPSFDTTHVDTLLDKGDTPGADGYSAFEGIALADDLRERGVERITVAGLATDYCVLQTALSALREGFEVTVDSAAVRAVDVRPGDGAAALEQIRRAGGRVV